MPSSSSVTYFSKPSVPKVTTQHRDTAAPMLQAQADKKEYARWLSHCDSGCIAAVHPDWALEALAAAAAFPALAGRAPIRPTSLYGAWAARQQPAATVTADADDVLPRTPAPATPYLPPALRYGASAATLAGCPMPCPAPRTLAATPAAPYVPPHRRSADQHAAAAAAPRPGRPCAFPALTAGPQPAPQPAPLALYCLALLYSSQPLQCFWYVRC